MRKWSKDEEKALQKLYPAFLQGRLTRENIEAIMHRSWYSIMKKATILHLSGKTYTIIDKELYRNAMKKISL